MVPRTIFVTLAVALSASLLPAQDRRTAQSRNDSLRAVHVLNRLAFGPRPGDVDRVLRMGIDNWIEAQLAADGTLDSAATKALDGCPLFTEPVLTAVARLSGPESFQSSTMGSMRVSSIFAPGFLGLITRDSIARMTSVTAGLFEANAQLIACRLARVESTEQQLLEVMTDFWLNHFSISGLRIPARGSIIEYDRGVIRPNALGRFRILLGAVAHNPAMLNYLDNNVSTADPDRATLIPFREVVPGGVSLRLNQPPRPRGLNENYARELMELHTLGVDGGYTQQDVINVARAFTGWTHTGTSSPLGILAGRQPAAFVFDSSAHDAEPKVVLGRTFEGGRGVVEGEEILDMLTRHPATARHIARKLAVRFLSDVPPPALVDRAAATFLRTGGDIRETLRVIVTSEEFFAPEAFRAKVKTPLEFVLSMRRALNAPPDVAAEGIDFLVMLQQPPFGRISPDGWPETAQAWLNVGAMSARIAIATGVAGGDFPSLQPEKWPEFAPLLDRTFDVQVERVIEGLLGGEVSRNTREVLMSARQGTTGMTVSREATLRELIGLALGSPEFQRR
jgi:uncharacterized protein (DUF1800 family)